MSHVRLSAIAVAFAIVTTIIVGVVMVSRPARAQSTGMAQCTQGSVNVSEVQAWMNRQIAAKRTRFVFSAVSCAW